MTAMRGPGRVPVAPLREAFLASPMGLSEVCHGLGWARADGSKRGETSRLSRALGLDPSQNVNRNTGKVYRSLQVTIDRPRALAICSVLDVDFDELYADWLPAQRPRGGRCVMCGERMLSANSTHTCGFCLDEIEHFGAVDRSRVA